MALLSVVIYSAKFSFKIFIKNPPLGVKVHKEHEK